MTVERPSGPFRIGDRVQLTGPKGRLHTITLREDGELHTHHGVLRHTALIGQPDGSVVANSGGHEYLALRPLLRDFVMSMPRGAAIVYPKDAAQILAAGRRLPGRRRRRGRCRVGCAVALAAARDRRRRATGLVRAPRRVRRRRAGERRDVPRRACPQNWERRRRRPGRRAAGCRGPGIRRPRRARHARAVGVHRRRRRCAHARGSRALLRRDGHPAQPRRGVHPRDGALHRTRRERDDGARLARRGTRRPSRPSHGRAHRLPACGRGAWHRVPLPPEQRRRASKSSYGDEDVELWTPGAVGDRQITDKNLRKRVREAERAADGARTAAHGTDADDDLGVVE